MNIGEIIRELRELKEMGLNELAQHSGVPSSYLSSLEQGKKANPSFNVIMKIFKAMFVNDDEAAKILLSLSHQDITWHTIRQEIYEMNDQCFNDKKAEELQQQCLNRIVSQLVLYADSLTINDLSFIAETCERLVKHLALTH